MKKLDSLIIAGISIKTTNQNNQSRLDIPKLWERFFQEKIADKINNKMNDNIYVVYTDYDGDYTKPNRLGKKVPMKTPTEDYGVICRDILILLR